MKSFLNKVWNYSPAQIVSILRNKIYTPRQIIDFRIDSVELKRLQNMPRYQETDTRLFGKTVHIIDASSYLSMLDELFVRENYKFIASRSDPLIIDCGANIGLGVIFFKLIYPKSKIIAFEPDKKAFLSLEKNIKSFGFENIKCHNEAVWTTAGQISFHVEGSWGGKIDLAGGDGTINVNSVRLSHVLEQKVDFLKIDIEGSETEVISDCINNLVNVKNIFMEYHSSTDKIQTLPIILSALSSAKFRYYIKEASSRKHPFTDKVISGFDLQLDISAYRD